MLASYAMKMHDRRGRDTNQGEGGAENGNSHQCDAEYANVEPETVQDLGPRLHAQEVRLVSREGTAPASAGVSPRWM